MMINLLYKCSATTPLNHIEMKENQVQEDILFVTICNADVKVNLADMLSRGTT